MAPGKFITFEGGEGSGKSTQSRLLAERLGALGIDVLVTREPGGTPFAEAVRNLILSPQTPPHSALSEALLFYAARADHLDKIIRPNLDAGRWVVCDRFSDSTRVYQGYAGTVPLATIDVLERLVVHPTGPDLTFVIDVDPRVGLARAASRRATKEPRNSAPDAYEKRDPAFHARLRDGFLSIAAADLARCVVVDGGRGAEEVAAAVWASLDARLLAGIH
jgi:dTMP kinase